MTQTFNSFSELSRHMDRERDALREGRVLELIERVENTETIRQLDRVARTIKRGRLWREAGRAVAQRDFAMRGKSTPAIWAHDGLHMSITVIDNRFPQRLANGKTIMRSVFDLQREGYKFVQQLGGDDD